MEERPGRDIWLGRGLEREVWFRGQYSAEGRKHGIRGELIG